MKSKSLIISAFLLSSSNLLHADKMKSYADSVVLSVSNPTSMSLKDRTVLHGGGVSIKAPIETLTPLNIQTPSMKAGCGGIDLTFGSLSFLSGDQMVAFAENIMAAAPGVAFDLALKAVCPSCADTLKALEELANQVNNMAMDSCNAAKFLGNTAQSAIFGDTKSEVDKGGSEDWLKSFNETYLKPASSFMGKFNKELGNLGYNQKFLKFFNQSSTKSYVSYAFDDKTDFNSDLMSDSIRAMMGDIRIIQKPSGDHGGKLSFENGVSNERNQTLQSKEEIDNTKKILKRLIGDESVTPRMLDDVGNYYQATNSNFPAGSLLNHYKDKVNTIIDKFSTRSPLTDDDIKFLSYFKDPIYKIFNMGATTYSGASLLRSTAPELSMMLSSQIMYELIISAHMIVTKDLQELKAVSDDLFDKLPYDSKGQIRIQLQDMSSNIRKAASSSYLIYVEAHKAFAKKLGSDVKAIKAMQELKRFTMQRTNPELFFNYTVGLALSGK